MNEPRRILVVGASGFVGGRLVEYLLTRSSHQVVGLVRDAKRAVYRADRSCEIVLGDLTASSLDLNALCRGAEVVINLSGLPAEQCFENPIAAVNTNVVGTLKLLEAAGRSGVKRFIQVSTIHVFGQLLGRRLDEISPPAPVHAYGITHCAAERFVLSVKSTKMRTLVLRLSNAFGPPHHPNVRCWHLVANDLCRQAVQQRALMIRSSGYQHRDFVPVSDVVRAIVHLAESADLPFNLFHLGGRRSLSIRDLASLVADRYEQLTGREIAASFAGAEPIPSNQPVNFGMERLLSIGFQPQTRLEEELDACICLLHPVGRVPCIARVLKSGRLWRYPTHVFEP